MSRGGRKKRKKLESIRRMGKPSPVAQDNVAKLEALTDLVRAKVISVEKAVELFYE